MTTAELAQPSADAEIGAVHMIRADLDIRGFHRWAGSRGLISRSAFDEGFAMHCLLNESFGELAPRPFRVIIPRGPRRRMGTLYGYTECTADDLREAASRYCDPLQAKILPSSRIDSKLMPTAWRVDSGSALRRLCVRSSAAREAPTEQARSATHFSRRRNCTQRAG